MEGNGNNKKFQLIGEDQTFNERGIEAFIRESGELSSCGVNYSVISIIGPQSSGKSTLLNHIFETTFPVMNEEEGISQTTKGIWMAKCTSPCILILDIEGTDGRERGQEDTSFENRSALFSLSVSDIVMINMWYQEIGRVNGAGIPLLQLVFRERVRLNLPQRQTTLLIVVRDYNFKTKLEATKKQIGDILNEIWTTITKQAGRSNLQFSEYFKYDAVPVPHLQHQADDFRQKAKELRELFSQKIADQSCRIPISGLTMNTKKIWSVIQKNEDLNIPSIRIMVSKHMCSQIVKEKLQSFQLNENYKNLLHSLDTTSAQEFRVQVKNLIDTCMNSYREKTKHYDENARVTYGRELISELYKLMKDSHQMLIKRIYKTCLASFVESLKTTDNVYNASDSALNRFKKQCAEVTCPEFGREYKFVERMKDDMKRKVDGAIREQEKRKAEERVRQEKIKMERGLLLAGMAASIATGVAAGIVACVDPTGAAATAAAVNIYGTAAAVGRYVRTSTTGGQSSARLPANENENFFFESTDF